MNAPLIRVMIVDDSAVIRGLLQRVLSETPGITVAAYAFNGAMAIIQARETPVDVILLDVEMPEMDGMTALPQLRAIQPAAKIIMVSTLTLRNAEITLKAFELGASDYVAKPTAREDKALAVFYQELVRKIQGLGGSERGKTSAAPHALSRAPLAPVRALAIGASTGGPQALATLFKALKGRVPNLPIFITQHMPPHFTLILARQLEQFSGVVCVEGADGMPVKPGVVYIAPGDFHMRPEQASGQVCIRLDQGPQVNFCRPAVDPMLDALSAIYGKHLLTVILTGMGSDGAQGAKRAAQAGGAVAAQDEASSVVYGMPKAVMDLKIGATILPLSLVADYIVKACA